MHTHMLTLVTKQLVSDGSELGIKTATFCHIYILTCNQSLLGAGQLCTYM